MNSIEDVAARAVAAKMRAADAEAWLKVAVETMTSSTDRRCRVVASLIAEKWPAKTSP